jgi:hypothetical protein
LNRGDHTQILGGLAGDSHFLDDRPFSIVLSCLVVAVVDMIVYARFLESLAHILSQRLPTGMSLLPTSHQKLDFNTELERALRIHGFKL